MRDYLEMVDEKQEELLADLAEILAVPSVAGEAEGDYPFGKPVHDVFMKTLAMAERDGFTTANIDNYGGHIDFKGETDDVIALVGHLDVVPVGDVSKWSTDPFQMKIEDGKVYARGAVDDKGPLMAGYYAMKVLKEAGFKPNKTIRLIIGLDEETEWKGMEYYMDKVKDNVVAGFSPDACFPAIHAEKGVIAFNLSKAIKNDKADGLQLVSIDGGTVANAVCDSVTCRISFGDKKDAVMKKLKEYIESHDYEVKIVGSETICEITVKGVAAHAAYPELGLNAISVLLEILGTLEFENEQVQELIKFFNDHIGFDYNGQRIGMGLEDEPTGKLTFNVGIIKLNSAEIKYTINVRYPVTCQLDNVYKGLEDVVLKEGYSLEKLEFLAPLYKPADDPLIVALMDSYIKFTGDVDAKPITIGGATYARAVPNTVAFGPIMPGKIDMCHKANEYIEIEDLMRGTKIFADVIYRLAK